MPHKKEDVPPMDALGGGMDMNTPNIPLQPPVGEEPQIGDNVEDGGFNGMDNASDDGLDPKKSLQQLTGKLSQELRNYNNDQEQPDEDLNKYVAGMIIPQATKAMTDKGKKEVINKIKKGITDDEVEEPNSEIEDNGDNDMQMESRLYEIINNILDDTANKRTQRVTNKTLPKKSPFRSNR